MDKKKYIKMQNQKGREIGKGKEKSQSESKLKKKIDINIYLDYIVSIVTKVEDRLINTEKGKDRQKERKRAREIVERNTKKTAVRVETEIA